VKQSDAIWSLYQVQVFKEIRNLLGIEDASFDLAVHEGPWGWGCQLGVMVLMGLYGELTLSSLLGDPYGCGPWYCFMRAVLLLPTSVGGCGELTPLNMSGA